MASGSDSEIDDPTIGPNAIRGADLVNKQDVEMVSMEDREAYARQLLKPGETILGEGVEAEDVADRGILQMDVIKQFIQDIEYKVPEGAERVPWVDTLAIHSKQGVDPSMSKKDGYRLEAIFIEQSAEAVRQAYENLRIMKIPASRPHDFYAEMMKDDKQMYMVRRRAAEEHRRIKIVDARRAMLDSRAFKKGARAEKALERQKAKRQTLEDVQNWKDREKSKDKPTKDGEDPFDAYTKKKKNAKTGKDAKEAFYSHKRMHKDAKYGFGGPIMRRAKKNTRDSTNDLEDKFSSKAPNPYMRRGAKGAGKAKKKKVLKKGGGAKKSGSSKGGAKKSSKGGKK